MDIQVLASSSKGNAYVISDGKSKLLLECGISIKELQKATNFTLTSFSGCLISHSHKDHCKAVNDVLRFMKVYTSAGTIEEIGIKHYNLVVIKSLQELHIASFMVLPFWVHHDTKEPLGFLIESKITKERLLFFTDTNYLIYIFDDINYIMGECNYDEESILNSIDNKEHYLRVKDSHMGLETFKRLLKASWSPRLKAIYLLHLSDDNSNEDFIKKSIQKITGAEVYVAK